MSSFYGRIAAAANRFGDRPAIEMLGSDGLRTTTYAALIDEAGRWAAWLEATGTRRGDRVAILSANDAQWVAAYLGILRLGAVAVPLDTAYSAAQIRTVLDDSGARLLLASPRLFPVARDATAGAATVTRVGILSGPDAETTLRPESGPPPEAAPMEADEPAVILYTSGTTSDPKGVVLTHANLEAERAAAFGVVDVTEEDRVLGVLPLFHALAQMANLLLPLAAGARVVFLETVNSATLLEALDARQITIFACVPQFFYLIHERVVAEIEKRGRLAGRAFRLLLGVNTSLRNRLGWNLGPRLFARVHRTLGPSMRLLITGGSRFDPDVGRDLFGLGLVLINGYGLTETSGGASLVRPGDRYTSSVGQALPGIEIRIAREHAEGIDAAADSRGDDSGEILIRGPIVMREYYRRPDATADTLVDGWLRTGDLGRLDREGRLYITGRKKDVIVLSSGKNLYPEEIEAHYRRSPVIKELCVLGRGVPGQPAAERLHAVIVTDDQVIRQRGVVNLRELVRFEIEGLSIHLPAHKRILTYEIATEPLPRTSTGKLRRNVVERQVAERSARPSDERPPTPADLAWAARPEHEPYVRLMADRLRRTVVRPDDHLELDLGLDSMERVELLTALERLAGTRVSPEARAGIFNARQLVDAVRSAPEAAGADAADVALPWDVVLAEPPDQQLVTELARPKLVRAFVIFSALRAAATLARLAPGWRATGREHLPASGPAIIAPNHQSYFDGFFLAAALPFRLFRHVFFVGAAEYFQSPLMKAIARAINIVPVDPDAHLVNAMRAASAGLGLGKVLILFPEGERSIDGALRPFRKGAAILAAHTGAPLVPVALEGLFPLWPRGRPLAWRRLLSRHAGRVQLTFGAPNVVSRGDYAAGTEALHTAVTRLLASR